MRLIGITGGIGTGKSTVTSYLQTQYHLPIWDADIYARSAVSLNSPILKQIIQRYGNGILQADGTLDRRRLGKVIFDSLDERHWLEAQIHPYIRNCFEREISLAQERLYSTAVLSEERIFNPAANSIDKYSTAVLAVPLLFEAQMTDLVTEIWVVSCDAVTQVDRIMTRDNLTKAEAKIRIDSQMPLTDKIAQADVNLDNSTTIADLERQIDRAIATER